MDFADPENYRRARAMLTAEEGERLRPYVCPAGHLTIGIGHNLDDHDATPAEVNLWLVQDLSEALRSAKSLLPKSWATMDPIRKLAVINMVFQLGGAGFKMFIETRAQLEAGNYAGAAEAARKSLWFTQTPERATRVLLMLSTGVWPY